MDRIKASKSMTNGRVAFFTVTYVNPLSANPKKMVKYNQTIRRPFYGVVA